MTSPNFKPNEPTPSWMRLVRHPLCLSVLLAALTWALFSSVGKHQFINLDDPDYFTENAHVQGGLTFENLKWALGTGHAANWHPLTWWSLMLDVQLFGNGPTAPHLVNAGVHVANTVLLFLLLRSLTGAVGRSAFVAALFAWHPLHVESVAWVAERKDVLSGFFFLLTLWSYVRYTRETKRRGTVCLYLLTLLLFVCGVMSKPMVVTLPFVLLLLDYWPLARFQPRALPGLLREKIPFFVVAAGSSIITVIVQKTGGGVRTLDECPLGVRIENTFVAYVRYLGKTFWPTNLATPYADTQSWPLAIYGGAALLLLVLTLGALWLGRKHPYVVTGWFWFVGTLVPVIGIVQVGSQAMADRYTYLPLIGIFMIAVWGGAEILTRGRVPSIIGASLAALILIGCAVRTHSQLRLWKDTETLLSHAVAVTENNWIALCNLGEAIAQQGRMAEALPFFRQGVAAKPNSAQCRNNLGLALVKQGQYAEAIPHLETAARMSPDFIELQFNLGLALRNGQRYDEAIEHYQACLQLQPGTISAVKIAALKELGLVFGAKGNEDLAEAHLRKALEYQPDDPETQLYLAQALIRRGQIEEGKRHLAEALRLRPGWPEAESQLRALDAPPN